MGRDRRNNNRGCCSCFGGCFFTLFALVAVVVLSCGGLYLFLSSNEPQPLFENFTPSASLANNLESKISTASTNAARNRSFTLILTDAEVSSWLNLNAPEISEEGFPMRNFQVTFRDGKARMYGDLDAFGVTEIGTEVVAVLSNPNGQLEVQIESAEMAGIALPSSVTDTISEQIKKTIDQELISISGTYRITAISMSNTCNLTSGSCLTISATVR